VSRTFVTRVRDIEVKKCVPESEISLAIASVNSACSGSVCGGFDARPASGHVNQSAAATFVRIVRMADDRPAEYQNALNSSLCIRLASQARLV